jgi:hypothetical protein
MYTKRLIQLMITLAAFPLTAALVGTAYAKGKSHSLNKISDRAIVVSECVNNVSGEIGKGESLAINEACTCVADKKSVKASDQALTLSEFLRTKRGSKEFGRCLFLAKDGL